GVESEDGATYRRTVCIDGRPGVFAVSDDPERGCLELVVAGVATADLFFVVQKVRELFDLDAPVTQIRQSLAGDPSLKSRLGRRALPRVPGAWDGFELAVRAVLGQQVSVKAATTLSGRIVARYGTPLDPALGDAAGHGLTHLFPAPDALARRRFDNLGITGARIATIRRLALAVAGGEVAFDSGQDADAVCRALTDLPGIGNWTAQYIAMRALKNPDAFPASDLGLLRAFDEEGGRLKPAELLQRAEAWRPWRAYAAMLLWSSLVPGTGNQAANSGG
ncbi:MAG TPA: AlkA N-terminal domain-containing protein, partial [Woeseiaceae bacterium]|nr:AlkA N-terminal domain-containing protein [Woeseiaceae bacterium]